MTYDRFVAMVTEAETPEKLGEVFANMTKADEMYLRKFCEKNNIRGWKGGKVESLEEKICKTLFDKKEEETTMTEKISSEVARQAVEEAVKEVKEAAPEKKAEVAKEAVEEACKKVRKAQAKEAMIARVDAWVAKVGEDVTAKGYANYSHVRDIKVNGKTVFQLWISANGVRMCGRTRLIPEAVRPAGSTIIKDGFDLSIPTFTEVEADLDKYLAACKTSLAEAENAKKAKAEAKVAAAKAEKEAKAAAKKAEKEAKAKAKEEAKKAKTAAKEEVKEETETK